jgi:hypothetical protein
MYPSVRKYGDIDAEPFESYYARWPARLSGIPREVVQDWIHRHWQDFKNHWVGLEPHKWTFSKSRFSNEQILAIGHIGTWIPELDAEGVEFVSGAPRSRTRLAQFMLSTGSYPVPILVAKNAGHVIHPRSNREPMKQPYQLIEGHSRLACLRGMINACHPNLANSHEVWLAEIPADLS